MLIDIYNKKYVNNTMLFLIPLVVEALRLTLKKNFSFLEFFCQHGLVNCYSDDMINNIDSDYKNCAFLFFTSQVEKDNGVILNQNSEKISLHTFFTQNKRCLDYYTVDEYNVYVVDLSIFEKDLAFLYNGEYSRISNETLKLISDQEKFSNNKENIDLHLKYINMVLKKDVQLKMYVEEELNTYLGDNLELHNKFYDEQEVYCGDLMEFNFKKSNNTFYRMFKDLEKNKIKN